MPTEQKKAAGYIRVSTPGQAKEGESLNTQREAIEEYCKRNNLELVHTYRDEGISGGTVQDRPGLLDLLSNIENVDYVLVHRLSRLGRNARELLNNVHDLNDAGVQVLFLKENLDQSTPYGKVMLTMMAAFAEMEKEITGEASLENKINRCKAGVPATGKFPFGRKYDRETGQWYYDPPDIPEVFQDIARRYLDGESLRDIADTIPRKYQLTYTNILKVFRYSAGSKWEVHFKSESEPIVYDIPPLLDDDTLKAVRERLAFNTKFNRKDAQDKYLLSGFVFCMGCGRALTGQIQQGIYCYYRHPAGKREKCYTIRNIKAKALENAVFKAIFENTMDQEGFEQAIQDNFGDENKANELKEKVRELRTELDQQYKQQDKIAKAFIEETLSPEMLKKADKECSTKIEKLKNELSKYQKRLDQMPAYQEMRDQAERIRIELKEYFGSKDRLEDMTWDEKRRLLHAVFDGKDQDGNPFGIYVEKIGDHKYNYFIYAQLFHGIRTLYKDDPDYQEDEEPQGGNGNGGGSGWQTIKQPLVSRTPANGRKPKYPANKGSKDYKTKINSIYNRIHCGGMRSRACKSRR